MEEVGTQEHEGDVIMEEFKKRFLLSSDLQNFTVPENTENFFPGGHRNQFHSWIDKYLDTIKKRKEEKYEDVKTKALNDAVDKMSSDYTKLLERARQCKNALTSKDFTYAGIMDDFIHTTQEFNKELDKIIKSLMDIFGEFERTKMKTVTSDSGMLMEKNDVETDLHEVFFLKHITNNYFFIEREAKAVKNSRTRRLSFKFQKSVKDAFHNVEEGIKKLPQMFRSSSGEKVTKPESSSMQNMEEDTQEPEAEKETMQMHKEDREDIKGDTIEKLNQNVDVEQKYEQN